jgi:hypothetical protein
MTVGAQRLRMLHDLTRQMHKHLRIGGDRKARGVFFHAVLGDFGSGKSHIGYLLKHDALTCGEELLVTHVQITGESRFPGILAALLRALRVAGESPLSGQGIELSAYRKLYDWTGRNEREFRNIIRGNMGNVQVSAANDFAQAVLHACRPVPEAIPMQQFIESWVARSQPKESLEVFEMIFRVFNFLKSDRCLMVIDEFEAIQSQREEEARETMQHIQDLHDDLAGRGEGLPATYLLCLSTPAWWTMGRRLLPSLLGEEQRVTKVQTIPSIEKIDVSALLYRYLGLFQLASEDGRQVQSQELEALAEKIWGEVSTKADHMRSVHRNVRRGLEELMGI